MQINVTLVKKNVKERGVKLEERFARENIKKEVLVVASKYLRNTTRIRNRALYLLKVPHFKILFKGGKLFKEIQYSNNLICTITGCLSAK